MIVDSSAIVAILLQEPGFEELLGKLGAGEDAGISAPTLLETNIVLAARLGRDPRLVLGQFVKEARLSVVAFGEEHGSRAVDAYLRFGRGRHPAALNFGDCIAYATAMLAGMPLLYVGDDFAQTDITAA
jgi:ribonuclease VapC